MAIDAKTICDGSDAKLLQATELPVRALSVDEVQVIVTAQQDKRKDIMTAAREAAKRRMESDKPKVIGVVAAPV